MADKNYIKNLITEIMENSGDNETEFEGQPLRLRCGEWTADESGVRLEYIDSRGTFVKRTASTVPIMPTALLYDPETELASVELKTRVRGRWRSVICPRSQISSAVKIVQLADKGIEVTSETAANLVKFLAEVISLNPDRIPERKTASRLGWFEGDFLPYAASASPQSVGASLSFASPARVGEGDRDSGGRGYCSEHTPPQSATPTAPPPKERGAKSASATYINAAENKHLLEPVREKGSLEKWVTGMTKYRESLAFRLMMGASFASPLLEPLNLQPFVFHLWGPTGCGKTLTLQAAMSVWGDPRIGGMTKTMNMTTNAMLSTSAFLRNLPFGGDELQIIKNRRENYDRLIMSCTEGMDRARMTYSSLNRTRTWRCAFLFTGEEPCVGSSSGGGAVNRVICVNAGADICLPCREVGEGDRDSGGRGNCSEHPPSQSASQTAPPPKGRGAKPVFPSPAELVGLFSENYGSAGRRFIEEYQKEPSAAKEIYDEYFGKLVRLDATGKQASAMAAILTGDSLACRYLFKDEQPISAETAARFMKSDSAVSVAKRAREFTEGLIAANVNMFSPGNISREIWGKIDEGAVLINKTILCRELKNEGYSFEAVKNEWAGDGFLVRNPKNERLYFQTTCYGTKASYIKLNCV